MLQLSMRKKEIRLHCIWPSSMWHDLTSSLVGYLSGCACAPSGMHGHQSLNRFSSGTKAYFRISQDTHGVFVNCLEALFEVNTSKYVVLLI